MNLNELKAKFGVKDFTDNQWEWISEKVAQAHKAGIIANPNKLTAKEIYENGRQAGIQEAVEGLQFPLLKEFMEGTADWYGALLENYKDKPCMICGIVPKNLKDLVDELNNRISKLSGQ